MMNKKKLLVTQDSNNNTKSATIETCVYALYVGLEVTETKQDTCTFCNLVKCIQLVIQN
jgi:hypothetical protein